MLKKMLNVFILSGFISACASKQLPIAGEKMPSSLDANMVVSAEVVDGYSDKNNLLFQINLESKDGRWIRVDSVDLDLSNSDGEPFNIIVGNDLKVWAAAKEAEKNMDGYNEGIAMTAIYGAGGIATFLGALNKDKNLAAVGAATMVGVNVYNTYKIFKSMQGAVQGVAQVPDTHILAPFTIPSNSLVKRWILVNFPTGRISRTAMLKLKTVEGDEINYRLKLVK